MGVSKKSLKNLSPVKPGERRAMKGEEPMSLILTGRVEPENVEKALDLIAEHGTKSKVINYLLRSDSPA